MVLYERSGEDIDRGLVGYWKLDDLKRIPSDGIIAHYKMNDNAANTNVIDSKSGNTGTGTQNTSLMTTVGKIGNALSFNGTSDYIDNSDFAELNINTSWTYALWVKANNPTGGNQSLLHNTHSSSDRFALIISGGVIKGATYNGSDYNHRQSTAYTSTLWKHVAISYDGGSSLKMYIDGSLITNTNAFPSSGSSPHFTLGVREERSVQFFNGSIDDVRIYDRALSSSEISQIYNSGTGTETTELFRNTIVAIDRAKFNNGTITGATLGTDINGKETAMFFDGVDDRVACPENDTNRFHSNPFSGSAWVYSSADGVNNDTIIELGLGYSTNVGYLWRINGGTKKQQFYSGNQNQQSNTLVPQNKWNHVAFIMTGTKVIFYLNGNYDGEKTLSIKSDSTESLYVIGTEDMGNRFQGKIKDVRIYNRVLTAGEVKKLYRLRK